MVCFQIEPVNKQSAALRPWMRQLVACALLRSSWKTTGRKDPGQLEKCDNHTSQASIYLKTRDIAHWASHEAGSLERILTLTFF